MVTNWTHAELVEIARKWASGRHGVSVAEFYCMNSEIADVIAFSAAFSTMIEVKVSRADFLKDKKKFFRRSADYGMGNYRVYCAPVGMIKETELPDGWVLLEVNSDGRARLNVNPYKYNRFKTIFWHELNDFARRAERQVLYSIARRATIKGFMPKICEKLEVPEV